MHERLASGHGQGKAVIAMPHLQGAAQSAN
jgi:hypothetical protein